MHKMIQSNIIISDTFTDGFDGGPRSFSRESSFRGHHFLEGLRFLGDFCFLGGLRFRGSLVFGLQSSLSRHPYDHQLINPSSEFYHLHIVHFFIRILSFDFFIRILSYIRILSSAICHPPPSSQRFTLQFQRAFVVLRLI